MATFGEIGSKLEILILVFFVVIAIIAIVRTTIKVLKGKSISVPPVGVMNDLPSSVTGINKHDDKDTFEL